jgi:hypothetical protein
MMRSRWNRGAPQALYVDPYGRSRSHRTDAAAGHEEFFVFYNTDTNRVNVLYRRKNGDYGLIDPEVG